MQQHAFDRQGAILLAQSDGCAVWQFRNDTGDGTMTTYEVFPGVMLSFNDFHMARFESSYVADRRLFAIDHCREGRMEYSPGDNMLAYTEAGDMKLDLRMQHTGTFVFPSHHYHGLTVAMDRDIICRSLPLEMKDFPATPEQIIARWELGAYPRVVHGAAEMEHIFSELYRVPEKIRMRCKELPNLRVLRRLPGIMYLQIKITEIPQSRLVMIAVKLHHSPGAVAHYNAVKLCKRLNQSQLRQPVIEQVGFPAAEIDNVAFRNFTR